MSIVPLFYLDNLIARHWIKNTHYRGYLCNILLPLYGQSYNLRPSFYLFFEYFGLLDIDLKIAFQSSPFKEIKSRERAESRSDQIGKYFDGDDNYCGVFHDIQESIHQQLCEKRTHILNKTKEARTSSSEEYKELFGPLIGQIRSNYAEFVVNASLYLAWDVFCSLQLSGIRCEIVREVQLGIWNQIREQRNIILPLAKIVGGLIALKRGSAFGGAFDDMVDSEGMTFAVLQGDIFITYDAPTAVKERIFYVNQIITQLELTLKISIPRKPGRVICFSRPSNKLNKIEYLETIETAPTIYL